MKDTMSVGWGCHEALQTGRLKRPTLFLPQSRRLQSEIPVWAGLVPPEASLLGV